MKDAEERHSASVTLTLTAGLTGSKERLFSRDEPEPVFTYAVRDVTGNRIGATVIVAATPAFYIFRIINRKSWNNKKPPISVQECQGLPALSLGHQIRLRWGGIGGEVGSGRESPSAPVIGDCWSS